MNDAGSGGGHKVGERTLASTSPIAALYRVVSLLEPGGADAALVAGMLHDGSTSVRAIKAVLAASGLPVRVVA